MGRVRMIRKKWSRVYVYSMDVQKLGEHGDE